MNLLIVDDQITVLDGLLHGIHFNSLKISHVYTATNVSDAKKILKSQKIQILMSDIEMPGENGLMLNKWAAENYPALVRILLTSHAVFDYAKEAMKLGCFDYIVQPAPYHEIENALARAVSKVLTQKQLSDYYRLEVLSNIVLNLFSSNPANKEHSLASLNQMGYMLNNDSSVQAVIIDIYPYVYSTDPVFSDSSLFVSIMEGAARTFTAPNIYPLICLNRFKQFVLLLITDIPSASSVSKELFDVFYQDITGHISPEISCYVTPCNQVKNIRDIILPGHQSALNNVAKKTGLYFSEQGISVAENMSLSENVARWTRLLKNSQFTSLEENIFSYLDYNTSLNHFNLETLSQFHQELTKLFFIYSYNRKIDIMSLFSEDYNYNEYMSCFKDVKALKKGISYLINAISGASCEDESKDTVQRSIDYILENISKDISVKDVAEYVCFSPEYFSKLFKKETGENVKNYILRVKVEAAKDLLKNPNIPVSMVASELGYSNFSHFTQMFKKHEGVTPSEYRKKYGEGN
ncbi:helix-turn-helix domain-containing protein [Mediterraneibacter sp. NSJ-55]|uniref:Stage 0 sporulation protein A homolog n=1 Tax=Mediterraneibacter hominis TaxID=2763054 RepID=A0A923LJ02_9FIRM|nr:helix-turn-helix domain-containing protein [Mediterraneibacter hominis]MBC5689576.1 helix-turn-helix domain-containing protein [Mediterraneibacter hominis]